MQCWHFLSLVMALSAHWQGACSEYLLIKVLFRIYNEWIFIEVFPSVFIVSTLLSHYICCHQNVFSTFVGAFIYFIGVQNDTSLNPIRKVKVNIANQQLVNSKYNKAGETYSETNWLIYI